MLGSIISDVLFELISGLTSDQELEEPEKVSAAQNLFFECFLRTLTKSRGEENVSRTFAKLVEHMTSMRTILNDRQKSIKHLPVHELPAGMKFPRIAAEVFDLPEALVDDLGQEFMSLNVN